MKQGDGTEHELNLLLEDYGKSSRQWRETVHSEVHSSPNAIFRDRDSRNPRNAKADRLTIILLLEDYPSRAERWLSQFSSAKVLRDRDGAADRSPSDATLPPLELLLEDYAPGARFLFRLQESSGKAFDSNGLPDPRTRELPQQPSAPAALPGVTAKVTEAGPDGEKQTSAQELQPDTQIPRPVGAPRAPEEVQGAPGGDAEIRLLLSWGTYIESSRRRGNAISAIVHAMGVLLVLLHSALAPGGVLRSTDLTEQQEISLFAPTAEQLARLTQPLAGEGPPTKEFRGAPEEARPLLVLPQIIEPEPPVAEPEPAPDPQLEEETTPPEPEPSEAEAAAPKPLETEEPVETPAAQSPSPGEFQRGREFARGPTELPAPRAPSRPLEKPKLVLEDPKARMPSRPGPVQLGSLELSARMGKITEGVLRQLREGGVRQAVGDGFGTGGLGGYLPPSPGNTGSNLELLSDPQGVDFRPYLLQILATVRRNWFAVIPESARLGMSRGRVAIQFAIGSDGSVPKLVIATSSGVTSLDRAAVAAISASNPFPSLPANYSGKDVRLQFQFRYNIKGQ